MECIRVSKKHLRNGDVEIQLPVSKSIANRLLVLCYLSGADLPAWDRENMPLDVRELYRAISGLPSHEVQAGEGGTSFRFLLALLALDERPHLLSASGSMKHRPIGPLVEGLRALGATIDSTGKEGGAPVIIRGGKLAGGRIRVQADQSSQFISALMMVGPFCGSPLELVLEGHPVSQPYLKMTAQLMRTFGIEVDVKPDKISVPRGHYSPPSDLTSTMERDWTACSYFLMLGMREECQRLHFPGLRSSGLQGDQVLMQYARDWGWRVTKVEEGIDFVKLRPLESNSLPDFLDFSAQPDLAPTVMMMAGLVGKEMEFGGVGHLTIKESDRIGRMNGVLAHIGKGLEYLSKERVRMGSVSKLPPGQRGGVDSASDHRIAMAASGLALVTSPIKISGPGVVEKSFPGYWNEMQKMGFTLSYVPHP